MPSLQNTEPDIQNIRLAAHELDDAALIALVGQGDKVAIGILISRHLPKVVALARRMLPQIVDAEDVAQEVFLKLWQNAQSYDPSKAKFTTWLYRITSNSCIDKIRQRQYTSLAEDYDEAYEADQERVLEEKQRAIRVEQAMNKIPGRQKMALVLFHYQAMSLKEIAAILDLSIEAVESLLARARRGLKKHLADEWQEFTHTNSH